MGRRRFDVSQRLGFFMLSRFHARALTIRMSLLLRATTAASVALAEAGIQLYGLTIGLCAVRTTHLQVLFESRLILTSRYLRLLILPSLRPPLC
jgi:hypothetical protein